MNILLPNLHDCSMSTLFHVIHVVLISIYYRSNLITCLGNDQLQRVNILIRHGETRPQNELESKQGVELIGQMVEVGKFI